MSVPSRARSGARVSVLLHGERNTKPSGVNFACAFLSPSHGRISRLQSLQVKPGTKDADGDVLHITVSVAYLRNRRIEGVILSVPYASHVLDVYTSRREDKRTLLQACVLQQIHLCCVP
jgi:hypothetical protein